MASKETLAKVSRDLLSKYGSGAHSFTDNRRLPTGSLRLDGALGGGIPVGKIVAFYGEKSGGKTTTAKRCMGIAQQHCRNCYRVAMDVVAVPPAAATADEVAIKRWSATGKCTCFAEGIYQPDPPTKEKDEKPKALRERIEAWRQAMTENSYEEVVCAWVDMENAFDQIWARKLGLDTNRLFFVRPESAEEALDITAALVGTAEVDMLCLDSIAQLTPTSELTESMEKWQQGLQARLVNKGARKLVTGSATITNQHRAITQIWINQVREKITMFGDPTTKPGGKGQEFAVFAEIKFGRSKMEMAAEVFAAKDDVIQAPVSEKFSFKVTKNRTASTKDIDGHYVMQSRDNESGPAGRVLEDEEIFKMAMHFLVEQKKKEGIYILEGREYTSQKSMAADLRDDKALLATVRGKLLHDVMLKGTGV